MGIIRAAMQAVSGGFSDQYLEKIVPYDMGDQTVFTYGVTENAKDNKKGTANIISNGSKIQVYDNQMMILVDGGKIVDYTAEPGLYEVSNSSMPSLFNGQFGDSLKEAFERVKFGGGTPLKQEVFYINLQEIKGIKFGTRNPINYFDNMYNAELFLRAHGTYSIKIVNPLQFYAEVIPRNGKKVEITDINEQYLYEFLDALQSSINQMSADGMLSDNEKAIFALQSDNFLSLCSCVNNALKAPAAELNGEVKENLEIMRSLSPSADGMTGSGSTVVGIFETEELARWAIDKIKKHDVECEYVRSLNPQKLKFFGLLGG